MTHPADLPPVWCPQCRTRSEVTDTDTAHTPSARGELSATQTYLECGHTVSGPVTASGPYPEGAPYPGPDVAVAVGTRPADLHAARTQQQALDARGTSVWGDQ